MTTTWIVIVSVAAWLVVSLAVGRFAMAREYRRLRVDQGHRQDFARSLATEDAFMFALLWPVFLALSPIFGLWALGDWVFVGAARSVDARLDARHERIHQLRTDADSWDAKRTTGTDAERAVAAQVAQLCRDQADELAKGAGR